MKYEVTEYGEWKAIEAKSHCDAAEQFCAIIGRPMVVQVREWHSFLEWPARTLNVKATYQAEAA